MVQCRLSNFKKRPFALSNLRVKGPSGGVGGGFIGRKTGNMGWVGEQWAEGWVSGREGTSLPTPTN